MVKIIMKKERAKTLLIVLIIAVLIVIIAISIGIMKKTEDSDVAESTISAKIGDYVAYNYDEDTKGYLLTKEDSGWTEDQTIEQTKDFKWRILNINSDGTIDLVSNKATNDDVYFWGIYGLNNGVYLMNDICANQYSNKKLNITARSLSLKDIEKSLTAEGISQRNQYSGEVVKYGEIKTYAYVENLTWYPAIYGSKINKQPDINSISNPDPYGESDNVYENTTTHTYSEAKNGITVAQTLYNIEINDINYGESAGIIKDISNYNYVWMASRYVDAKSDYAEYGIYLVGMKTNTMFSSNRKFNGGCNCLCPVVTINKSIITNEKDENGAWILKE